MMFFIYMLTQHLIACFKITAVQNTNKQTKHDSKNAIHLSYPRNQA
jgi:hypothetical protein